MFLNINKMNATLGYAMQLHLRSLYSTVTDLARFFGLSISQPFSLAT